MATSTLPNYNTGGIMGGVDLKKLANGGVVAPVSDTMNSSLITGKQEPFVVGSANPTTTSASGLMATTTPTATAAHQQRKAASAPQSIMPESGTVTNWNVDPATQTVAGQVQGIIAEDSPLMQMARTRALQQQNARGTLNSSMAIGAGQAATYEAAVPIGTADAATYANAAKTNASEYNQTARTNAQNESSYAAASMSAGATMEAARLSAATQTKLADMKHGYDMELQGSQMAGSLYDGSIRQITNIYQDTNMGAEAKQNAIDNIMASTAEGLSLIKSMNTINLDAFLSF